MEYMEKVNFECDSKLIEFIACEVRKKVQNEEDVKDLTQDVLYRCISRFKQCEFFTLEKKISYVRKIANSVTIDFLRQKGKMKKISLEELTEDLPFINSREFVVKYVRETVLNFITSNRNPSDEYLSYIVQQIWCERQTRANVAREFHMSLKSLNKQVSRAFAQIKEQVQKDIEEKEKWNCFI